MQLIQSNHRLNINVKQKKNKLDATILTAAPVRNIKQNHLLISFNISFSELLKVKPIYSFIENTSLFSLNITQYRDCTGLVLKCSDIYKQWCLTVFTAFDQRELLN